MSLEKNISRRNLLKSAVLGAGLLFFNACNNYDGEIYRPQSSVIIPSSDTIKNKQMQEGVVLASWWCDDYEKPWMNDTLNKIHSLGVESVSILTTWYQDNTASLEINASSSKTPSDKGIEAVITKVKSLGMKTVLKPHIDLLDNNWRGNIAHTLDTEWTTWFEDYTNFITHYAQLAEKNSVDMLVIGTELEGTTHRSEWKKVISDVKSIYPSGKVVYCANHDRYKNVPFWDDLDGVGISAYFPKNEFATKTQEAKDFASQLGKKLYILEVGCQSRVNAGSTPWWINGIIDEQEQADYYQVAFDNLFNKCDGMFFWHVYHDLSNPDGFTFIGKKAEQIINDYYHRVR